jgi:hypothetical protein
LIGELGDDVVCEDCDIVYETDFDLNMDDDGGENYFGYIVKAKSSQCTMCGYFIPAEEMNEGLCQSCHKLLRSEEDDGQNKTQT